MFLADSTFEEVKEYLKNNNQIIIPFGAVEAHGKHLPIFTDVYEIDGIIKEAKKEGLGIMVAPTLYYTIARLLEVLPGTISLDFGPWKNYIKNILKEFCRTGFEKFYLITLHGDSTHITAIKEAVHELQNEFKEVGFIGIDLWLLLRNEARRSGISEDEIDEWHAGELETSLMMYLKPETVKEDKIESGEMTQNYGHFINSEQRNDNGVYGNPELATAEKGEKLIKLGGKILIDFIQNNKYENRQKNV